MSTKIKCRRHCWHKYHNPGGDEFCGAFKSKPRECKKYRIFTFCRQKGKIGPEWPIAGGGYGR
jgi:hypothetical protein